MTRKIEKESEEDQKYGGRDTLFVPPEYGEVKEEDEMNSVPGEYQ